VLVVMRCAREDFLPWCRSEVGDRSFAVGDLVICGKNAIRSLGVANATRGQVTALDTQQRRLTLQLEDGQTVTLPRGYLDERPRWWTRGNPDRRTLDLAYATTGHKAQGLTWERALVRVTGAEDANWLHVQVSGAKRDRLAKLLRDAPPDRTRLVAHTSRLREDAEQGWAAPPPPWRRPEGGWPNSGRAPGGCCTAANRPGPASGSPWPRPRPNSPASGPTGPPTSVRGGRVWRQATTLLSAYRDRYGVTDPEWALGPEPRRADVVQQQAWLDARQATERVHAKQRMSREQRLDRRERAHGDQPPTRPARSDRTRWPSTEERERRGRERKAG
jgi:hypothetical protein